MQTRFDLARLADPQLREADRILKTCVHCGLCLATCPTYLLLGDERDSPRGRIYMIKEMLEADRAADATTMRHVDRCLSCLSCATTCPSGVDYMRLVDHARVHIEATGRRPRGERWLRRLIAALVPHPGRLRLALLGASLTAPLLGLLGGRLKAMIALAPRRPAPPSWADRAGSHRAAGERRMRVGLLSGCAQQVLTPRVNEAAIRLLTRLGCEVAVAGRAGCCGALTHHMGRPDEAVLRRNIDAWERAGPFDAVVATASGCGTQLKEYGHILRHDPAWAERARVLSERARDISEVASELWPPTAAAGAPAAAPLIAYHAPCSLQHGQKILGLPKALLERAGFRVCDIAEGHICCGSAGSYNLLQPELAARLRARKAAHIEATGAGCVAAGNVGCTVQIRGAVDMPVVHPVELLDWASGGPNPL